MTSAPEMSDAVERAQRALDHRVEAVRRAVKARQHVSDTLTEFNQAYTALKAEFDQRTAAAETADVKAWNAALKTGWTATELRQIGLTEPVKIKRVRARASQKTVPSANGVPDQ